MALTATQLKEFSQILYKARKASQEVEPLTKTTEFDLADAYKIQADGIEKRLQDQEKIIGYKMGLTSKAKMEQMGLHTPIFGVLTNVMEVKNQGRFFIGDKIHPKAEPEVYFVTNRDLQGAPSPEEALAACERIGVALEILDSRFKGFKYFTLPDVVADNASSAFYVLGESVSSASGIDFKNLKIQILENEKVAHEDRSSAIFGDPLLSLCELVKLLTAEGKVLPKGSVVLAGAATPAIELKSGQQISATLEKVGRVSFQVN